MIWEILTAFDIPIYGEFEEISQDLQLVQHDFKTFQTLLNVQLF